MDIAVARGEAWELAWRGGASEDAPLRYVAGFCEQGGPPRRAVEPATAMPRVVVLFDGTVNVTAASGSTTQVRSFLVGPRSAPVLVDQPGSWRGIEVGLSVAGATTLAGMPLGELGSSIVALDDAPGRGVSELHDSLGSAVGWHEAFNVLDHWLPPLGGAPLDVRLQRAWDLIGRSGGQATIESVAADVGWSRRHLAVRMERAFGVTPKVAARLFRFERAANLLRGGTSTWAAATASGYFDQAHMHRDFALFTACTPGQVATDGPKGALEAAWPLDET